MVQPGIAALTRINELLKLKTEDEICGNRQVGKIENIVFSDVSFGYNEKQLLIILIWQLAEMKNCTIREKWKWENNDCKIAFRIL